MPNPRRTSLSSELDSIVRSFGSIQDSLARLIPLLESAGSAAAVRSAGRPSASAAAGTSRVARKLNLSPQRKAALKLQGQYMGYLRGLKAREQARVKALAAAKGVRAGVVLARKLAGKS